jgi:hypothetical protein
MVLPKHPSKPATVQIRNAHENVGPNALSINPLISYQLVFFENEVVLKVYNCQNLEA